MDDVVALAVVTVMAARTVVAMIAVVAVVFVEAGACEVAVAARKMGACPGAAATKLEASLCYPVLPLNLPSAYAPQLCPKTENE